MQESEERAEAPWVGLWAGASAAECLVVTPRLVRDMKVERVVLKDTKAERVSLVVLTTTAIPMTSKEKRLQKLTMPEFLGYLGGVISGGGVSGSGRSDTKAVLAERH